MYLYYISLKLFFDFFDFFDYFDYVLIKKLL
jgi:hypothetical protein